MIDLEVLGLLKEELDYEIEDPAASENFTKLNRKHAEIVKSLVLRVADTSRAAVEVLKECEFPSYETWSEITLGRGLGEFIEVTDVSPLTIAEVYGDIYTALAIWYLRDIRLNALTQDPDQANQYPAYYAHLNHCQSWSFIDSIIITLRRFKRQKNLSN